MFSYKLNQVETQLLCNYITSEAKKFQKKEKKMHDYEYIYPRGLYTDKEGGTTDASYPKDIFDKFPLRNWNKFLSKFFLTYFSPHVEKEPFFFYILTDCGVSAEAHGRLQF